MKETYMKAQAQMGDSIIIYLKEIGVNTKNWIDMIQDRDYRRALVHATVNIWIP